MKSKKVEKMLKNIGMLFCKIGWHKRPYVFVSSDGYKGICDKYKCKRCGFTGMIDSQGNLF